MMKKHQSGKEKRAEDKKKLTGIIRTTAKGMGFVEVEGYEEDIAIEPDFVHHALNGDEVEIILAGKYFDPKIKRSGSNPRGHATGFGTQLAGQVTKIIRRAKKNSLSACSSKKKVERGS